MAGGRQVSAAATARRPSRSGETRASCKVISESQGVPDDSHWRAMVLSAVYYPMGALRNVGGAFKHQMH